MASGDVGCRRRFLLTLLQDEFLTSPRHEVKEPYFRARTCATVTARESSPTSGSGGFGEMADDAIDQVAPTPRPDCDHYLRHLLFSMAADPRSGFTYRIVNYLLILLRRVMDESSVYPAITPDGEGGVSFEWSSQDWLIELDLIADGSYILVRRRGDGVNGQATVSHGRIKQMPIAYLRSLIDDYSRFVELRNPNWRLNFK